MKNKLTKKERGMIYSFALDFMLHRLNADRFDYGICHSLQRGIHDAQRVGIQIPFEIREILSAPSQLIVHFPEIANFTPKFDERPPDHSAYWFDLDFEGLKKRIAILVLAIAKAKEWTYKSRRIEL